MEYPDEFKKAVREDVLNRLETEEGFAEKFGSSRRALGYDLLRQAAYEKYAEKPAFKKYLEPQGFFSRAGDDLSNIGKAWNAGNFYSKGGWNDLAKNIINGGTPEDREKLYQQYLSFEAQNPMPENKTWVGDVVNGVANLVPLSIDMLPEAAVVGATTGAAGAALGSVVPGMGTVAGGVSGLKYGYKASMMEQSYKVGVADIYTTLREFGVDDDTAKLSALKWGTAYGALEYTGKALSPIQRKFLGGKILKEVLDKTVDKKLKNKIASRAAKYGIDVALTGTAESMVEGAQDAVTETARQGAQGDGYSPANIASAGWGGMTAAMPAMYGMAGLGIPLEAAANVSANKRKKDVENVQNAIAEGKSVMGGGVSVPLNTPLGGVFVEGGKFYRNVDGVAVPLKKEEIVKIKTEEAKGKPSAEPALDGKPEKSGMEIDADVDESAKGQAGVPQANEQTQQQASPEGTEASRLFMDRLQSDPFNVPQGLSPNVDTSLAKFIQMQEKLREAQARKAAEEAKKLEADRKAEEDFASYEAEREFEAAKARTRKTVRRLGESERLLNQEQKEARGIIDSIPDEDSVRKLSAIKGFDPEVLGDKDLDYALSHGEEWAQAEIERRERKREEESHDTLLDVMERNGYYLPTPNAVKRLGGGGDLYGEIKDLHDNLYAAGGKGRHYLQKFFRNQYASVDELVQVLNEEEGFSFSDSADLLQTLADNFAGATTTRTRFSLDSKVEGNAAKSPELSKIKNAVETIKRQFYKNAKRTANVEVISSKELARITGRPDARAAASRSKILIAGDKMKSPKQAAQIMLHEYVGHYGLSHLLGKDFAPFLAYVWNKYKDSAEWRSLKDKGYTSDAEIAEEMIAHLAEYRELSDPSMWSRLTARVRRALKDDGMSDAYVKLLDEDTLKSAVRLSRQWSKGDLAVNSKSGWKIMENTRAGRNAPPPDKTRLSIGESDAQRFKGELQDYKNGKRNFTMVLGTTPEVLKLCGVPDSNIELTDKTLTRKLAQHPELNVDALKDLPAEIADPIAVFQSQQVPNSVVVLTEIQTENGNVVAAIHFDIRNRKGFLVNDIRSIHGRPDGQIVNFVRNGMTLYVNTKRAPYWLKSPLVQFHGRDLSNKVLYGGKLHTQEDLSQAEKDNIFRLRGEAQGHMYSLDDKPSGKTRAELEAEHFGRFANNGDFDLNNIDLTDYEGIDTKDWDNEMWRSSFQINADIEHALNNPKEFDQVGDWLSAIGGEYLWEEKCPEISTRTLTDILKSRELAKLVRAGYKSGVSRTLAGIIAQPTATPEVRARAVKKAKSLKLFENTAEALMEFRLVDQEIVDGFVRDNAKEMRENGDVWWDYVSYFANDAIPSDIADEIIKWSKDHGAVGTYTLEAGLKKNVFSDGDKLKCVEIAPLSVAELDNNDAATIKAINDELMRRDDRYARSASEHIYEDIVNGNFEGNIALLKPFLKRAASFDEKFIEVTDNVIIELAGLKRTGYKAWSGDFSKRRPPQDLRDVAYYNALDRNAKEDAKAIIAERMKESEYGNSPALMHTSRAQNINTFKFSDDLARKNGEGVKAYGYGAYMTESPETTKVYRKKFANSNIDDLQIEVDGDWKTATNTELRAVYIRLLCDSEKEAEELIRNAKWSDKQIKRDAYESLQETKGKRLRLNGGKPRTYDIAWNLSPEETLELDLPFSKQNPEVQKKLLKIDRALLRDFGKKDFLRFRSALHEKSMRKMVEALEEELSDPAEASRILKNFGIRGNKFYDGFTRHKDGKKDYNYVSFEGGNALKLRESITRDEEGRIVPPSERFDPNNENWNFSLDDKPLTEREEKNIAVFNRNIQNGSSRLDISENEAYKQSGLNCNRIVVKKSVIEQAEKLGIDTDKIPYELLRPVAIPRENPQIKQVRILTSLTGKQNKQVCFQGSVDRNDLVVLQDILGYTEDGLNDLLNNDMRYVNERKAYSLKNRANYTISRTDAISSPNKPSVPQASIYSRPSQAKYSEKLEATMDKADNMFDGKKDKVVYSLRQMGLEVTEDKRAEKNSQYVDVHLDNGSTIYVRVSDHPAKTRIDVSIEKDWKAGTRFICEQADRGDWGTATNPNWQGDARWRFSFEDGEKYDGRFGRASRKYQKLRAKKQKELGKAIEFDQLPDLTADAEFESEVGMSKQEFADLMRERDRFASEISHNYQSADQKTKQALVDRFNPIKIVERFLNGGDLMGAEKSAYKALFAAGNMEQVMYNALYVGLPQYDRQKGQFVIRPGSKPLMHYLEKVKGKNYRNFANYAKAVAMFEHYKRAHNLETISDAYKYADSKEFYEMAGFTKEQAKKWMEEATADSKEAVRGLQEFFKANREFMVETGLASREQANVLNSFEYYLPMLREFDENDAVISGDTGDFKSRGFSGRSSGVKEFTGSKLKTKNVVESIIERTASLYANGYKNVAMQRSIQMLSEVGLARHAAKSSEYVKARISQAKHALENAGVKVGETLDDSELIPLEAFHIIGSLDEKIRDNIVSVRANGRLVFYNIADPELLVSLKSLGQEQLNVLTEWLIGASLDVEMKSFSVAEIFRDAIDKTAIATLLI